MSEPRKLPERISTVVLIGFMGAGKSTAGALLARRLAWPFYDMDELIVQRAGCTVATLFEREGEASFRRLEAAVIAEALDDAAPAVLALGGGALEWPSTRELLATKIGLCAVFLEAPLGVHLDRCAAQPSAAVRPLLQDRKSLEERFHARLPFYASAHLTVSTSGRTPEDVVNTIFDEIGGIAAAGSAHGE